MSGKLVSMARRGLGWIEVVEITIPPAGGEWGDESA